MVPRFLASEVIPFASIRLVRAHEPKLKLTAKELTACVELLGRGRSLEEALASIRIQRTFVARFLPLTPEAA